ncbi:unnamed protein product [Callosobruchus maculatus]|uniref:N-acetyl-D-glucosamine kinase n=1 Tax=Callosobruchus maculatus TaxID=64391 RepID=A0A653D021_CALMS|nr:unnamed protein product [Callosobruchus maculatus]
MSAHLVGGIEGGASNTHVVIMDSQGKIIGSARGPGTNQFQLGIEACSKRIASLTDLAKKDAGIPKETRLEALGLGLSGCETESSKKELHDRLTSDYPQLAEQIVIGSDTDGSVAATSNKGGVVCIAGTGSNTLLINPDGSRAQCGGWGHLLGDEGAAFGISHNAIKYCFDDIDDFQKAPYSIDQVWGLVKDHFKVTNQPEVLPHFYNTFDKAFIASLCKKLTELAKNGDSLAKEIFKQAGTDLAKAISAVHKKASKELIERDGGLHVLCVGSVWLSWDLLKPGFIGFIEENTPVEKLSLMKLKVDCGVGAAYMAADKLGLHIDRDYSNNYDVFFRYCRRCR